MPVMVAKKGDKFRVIEVKTGQVAKNAAGTPADGGGFETKEQAVKQVQAINISKMRQHHVPGAPPKPKK